MIISELLKGVSYTGNILDDTDIENIVYDSRNVNPNSCFVAIKGKLFDGHEYVEEALGNGAKLVVVEDKKYISNNLPVIKVDNSRYALSVISSNFFENPSKDMNIIGVTGTNGKTTVTYILKSILDRLGHDCGYLGTLGFMLNERVVSTGFTTPESLELQSMLKLIKDSNIGQSVLEVSSHSLDQDRVSSIDFNVAIFTNLTEDHLDYHKNMENYFIAKSRLFKGLKGDSVSVINVDDQYGKKLYDSINKNKISYAVNREADIFASNIKSSLSNTEYIVTIFNKKFKVRSNLIGEYNISNVIAAIGGLTALGYKTSDIIDKINDLDLCVPGRMELINQYDSRYVYIDYAHTPDAFEKLFSTIRDIDKKYEIISVFGCGGNRDRDKRSKMASIAEKYCNKVFVTSDNPRFENLDDILNDTVKGFQLNKHQIIKDRKIAIESAINSMSDKSILLILGKGRENYQIVENSKLFFSDVETVESYIYAN